MADAVKVTAGDFNSLLGLDTTKHADPTAQPDNTLFVSRFSRSELKTYLNKLYTKPQTQRTNVSASGLISYLKPIHKKIGDQKLQADKLRALAPEIEQSRILVSSSIMSPNDLQDGEFKFNFEDIPGIDSDPDLEKEISELYSEFFNGTLKLGIKSYDWIGEAQYGSGAKPILILPVATQIEFRHRTQANYNKAMFDADGALESFDSFVNKSDDYLYSGKPLTWKQVLDKESPASLLADMVPSMEEYGVKVPVAFNTSNESISREVKSMYGDKYIEGLESMIIKLKAKLNEGDIVRFTEDADVCRFHQKSEDDRKQSIMEKLAEKYGFDKEPIREEVAYLSANPEGYHHTGHPTLIELPAEAVMPIIVPGAPSEHLGYFILLDEHGMPLTIEQSGMADNSTSCACGGPDAAYEAMFGTNCCHSSYFNKENQQSSVGSLIFSELLDKYIRARMQGIINKDDVSIDRFKALSTILFYRVLEAKHSTIVFVPPVLLHYFAFEYDKNDGTGVSKTSEIQFLLSLRTTLMMANVVAMVNDAVEHKKVEFGVDDKNANIEGIMDVMANIFIDKNKLNGSIDPSEILRDIYSNSVTIVPKTVPGLSDLTVDVQSGGGQSAKVEDGLFEQLTNLLVSHLDVPPAALNQLAEPEFARSLVTYNLFFAKKIRRYQRIWCEHITSFIRDYTAFDPIFQRALNKKLEADGKKKIHSELPQKVKELAKDDPNKYSPIDAMAKAILKNVKVELATPNIVVDKTQFEEIRNFLGNLDEMANQLFSQELVPSEDQLAQAAIPILRAKWKRDQMMKFLDKVGSFNMVDIPDFDEFDPTELTDFIQIMQNTGSALQRHRENIGTPSENGGGGFGGEGGYGGSDAFGDVGGGDMGDMGDMSDMGGGDMGGGESSIEGGGGESGGGDMGDLSDLGGASMVSKLYKDMNKK